MVLVNLFYIAEKVEPKLVTCGSKHTLMLDSDGNIWYWGNKAAAGIKYIENEHQKQPRILLSANEEGPFIYISTKHKNNLAITSSGKIITFGAEENKSGLKIHEDAKESTYMQVASSG